MESVQADSKALFRDFVETVVNDLEARAVDDVFADDATLKGAGASYHGADEIKAFVQTLETAFPDFTFEIEDLLSEGHKVAAHVTVTGTHEGEFQGIPPTGREFSYPAVIIATVEDGAIAEMVYESDRVGLMKQLGVMNGH